MLTIVSYIAYTGADSGHMQWRIQIFLLGDACQILWRPVFVFFLKSVMLSFSLSLPATAVNKCKKTAAREKKFLCAPDVTEAGEDAFRHHSGTATGHMRSSHETLTPCNATVSIETGLEHLSQLTEKMNNCDETCTHA